MQRGFSEVLTGSWIYYVHLIFGLFQSFFETGQSKLETMIITDDMLFFEI